MDQPTDALQVNINQLVTLGYRVVSQTDRTAQLVKPKKLNFIACLLVTIAALLILGWIAACAALVAFILLFLAEKESQVYLLVRDDGSVSRTISGSLFNRVLPPAPAIDPGATRTRSGWVCAECNYPLLYTDDACPKCNSAKRKWGSAAKI
jgi:hypothetical protein